MGTDNIGYYALQCVAINGLKNQIKREGDYYDEGGFLICGKCGKARQKMQVFDPKYGFEPLKAVCECDCDKAEREAREEKERNAEKAKRIEALKRMSLIDDRLSSARIANYQENENNSRMLKIIKRYVLMFDELKSKNTGMLFWGGVGTGKSYAAACVANELIEQGRPVIMTSMVKVLENIQADRNYEADITEKMKWVDLVIFDDLGAERNTGYALEKVYNLIDERYRSGLPMIVTTNITLSEMQSEADIRYARIYDRVFENCIPMEFSGASWRRKNLIKKMSELTDTKQGE